MGFEKWEGPLGRQMGKYPLPVTNWTQNFNFAAKHSVAGLSEYILCTPDIVFFVENAK